MLGNLVIAFVLLFIGLLTGWGIPLVAKSPRPYSLMGDILASVLCMVVAGLAEWMFILPALNLTGWLAIVAAIGDPWFIALLILWLMRRMKG